MIIDHIKHIGFYEPMAAGITGAWNAIQAMLQEKGELPDGRYELKRGFFKVQRGETKPLSEGTFESHRKYIDVQILLEGQEEMAWMELDNLTEAIPYDAEKDAASSDDASSDADGDEEIDTSVNGTLQMLEDDMVKMTINTGGSDMVFYLEKSDAVEMKAAKRAAEEEAEAENDDEETSETEAETKENTEKETKEEAKEAEK